jgi:TPR repeat protein
MGKGRDHSSAKAASWFKYAAGQGVRAFDALGINYLHGTDPAEKGLPAGHFRVAADAGLVQAQCTFSVRYFTGSAVSLRISMRTGSGTSWRPIRETPPRDSLAELYSRGRGVAENPVMAAAGNGALKSRRRGIGSCRRHHRGESVRRRNLAEPLACWYLVSPRYLSRPSL